MMATMFGFMFATVVLSIFQAATPRHMNFVKEGMLTLALSILSLLTVRTRRNGP
jgi:hypothetical protein